MDLFVLKPNIPLITSQQKCQKLVSHLLLWYALDIRTTSTSDVGQIEYRRVI